MEECCFVEYRDDPAMVEIEFSNGATFYENENGQFCWEEVDGCIITSSFRFPSLEEAQDDYLKNKGWSRESGAQKQVLIVGE